MKIVLLTGNAAFIDIQLLTYYPRMTHFILYKPLLAFQPLIPLRIGRHGNYCSQRQLTPSFGCLRTTNHDAYGLYTTL